MLTEVKNQLKVMLLTIKYATMRELLNKVTFFTNVVFMILNNASFLIEWVVLFSIKEEIGGYTLKQVLLLWGISSFTYGISHFFFKRAYDLYDTINNGKLDAFLVQPKNVLIQCITSDVEPSAIGDMLYGIIVLFIYGFTLKNFVLFTILGVLGGLCLTSVSVILSSLSFWFNKTDIVTDTVNSIMTYVSTYPEGIFKGIIKAILYTIIPVGFVVYIPVEIILNFNIYNLLIMFGFTVFIVSLSFIVFYLGLRRYSSSNLMSSRI